MIELDDGLYPITVKGEEFRIDLIETIKAMDEINIRNRGNTAFEYVGEFREYLRANCQIDVGTTQADKLWELLYLEFYRQKKEWRDAVNLLTSTAAPEA